MCDLNLENRNLNEKPNDYIKNDGFKYCQLILKKKRRKTYFLKNNQRWIQNKSCSSNEKVDFLEENRYLFINYTNMKEVTHSYG